MVLPICSILALTILGSPPLPAVTGVDGQVHRLSAEAKGRPISLVFISHDCPICNTYAPELARIAMKYRAKMLCAIVYSEANLSRHDAVSHAKAYGLTHTELLLDPNGKLASACGATITPETVVVDSAGRKAYVGRIDDLFYDFGKARPFATHHDFRGAIEAVLNHRPATPASGPPFGCVIEASTKP